jgi:hypothetical protein
VASVVNRVASWLVTAGRRVERVGSFDVIVGTEQRPTEAIASLERGIALLERGSGVPARRVRRACSRILLRGRGFPRYWHLPRVIVLGAEELRGASNGWVALTLVHEATHARLHRLGLTARRFGIDRIERTCVRRERWLASTFPGTFDWVGFVDQRAHGGAWSRAVARRRFRDDLLGRGVPGWLAGLLAGLATFRHPE